MYATYWYTVYASLLHAHTLSLLHAPCRYASASVHALKLSGKATNTESLNSFNAIPPYA